MRYFLFDIATSQRGDIRGIDKLSKDDIVDIINSGESGATISEIELYHLVNSKCKIEMEFLTNEKCGCITARTAAVIGAYAVAEAKKRSVEKVYIISRSDAFLFNFPLSIRGKIEVIESLGQFIN